MSKGYRPPPTDTDLRPLYRSRTQAESSSAAAYALNRAPPVGERSNRPSAETQWPSRASSASGWSNRPSSASHWSSDGALSVLNSCGLDPSDLSLLAELPEDMLTVKSLPQVLSQIKGQKKGVHSNTSGYQPTGSAHRQLPGQSQPQYQCSTQRQFVGQLQPSYPGPVQSQAQISKDSPTSLEEGRWNYKSYSSSASSSSAGFVVDYGHRTAAPALNKTPERPVRNAQPSKPSQSFGALDQKEYRRSAELKLGTVKLPPPTTFMPTEKQAKDFHGMKPSEFPYTCSLCDILVLFDNGWSQHVKGSQHTDGQLTLLQRFPGWDCRLASVSGSQQPKEKKEREKKPTKKSQKKEASDQKKGKVVCVKFPPQSVDEPYLRKLTEPFGEITNVAMFPSLGFIELGSVEQAQEMVTSLTKSPPSVNDQQMEFTISNTFNFLQSSFVVFFSPVPFGKEGQNDLMTIIKRFGTLLFSMFLPEKMQAYIEMENAADAHKLVEYYSSTALKMNGVNISVSFSQEYRTLKHCALAQPYEDESVKKPAPKRPKKNNQDRNKKKQDEKPVGHNQEMKRSESREKSEEKSPEKSNKCDSTRSVSRDRGVKDAKDDDSKKDKASTEQQNKNKPVLSRPKEVESETKKSAQKSGANEQNKAPQTGSQQKTSSSEQEDAETVLKEQTEDNNDLSEEGSDIEGMQVMGEHLDEDEEEERNCDEDAGFPFDLENCITLDEVNDSDDQEEEVKEDENSSRVVFIGNLPSCDYTDVNFLKMVKSFGKPVRYFLNQLDRMGLVEMPSSAEATDLCRNLRNHSFEGSLLKPSISEKYNRLHSGWDVRYDSTDGKTSIEPSKTESKEKETGKTPEKSRELDKNDTKTTLTSDSETLKENLADQNQAEEGWVVYDDTEEEASEEKIYESIRIENVVSLKNHEEDLNKEELTNKIGGVEEEEGRLVELEETTKNATVEEEAAAILESEKKDEEATEGEMANKTATAKKSRGKVRKKKKKSGVALKQETVNKLSVEEEGWEVSNLSVEEETKAQNGGDKAVKRKGSGNAEESGPQKKCKDSQKDLADEGIQTEGGATETRTPNKPIGTEYVRYCCTLCDVIYSDEQEAKVTHCSSLQHYQRYQEITGKDPWTS